MLDTTLFKLLSACPVIDDICTAQETLTTPNEEEDGPNFAMIDISIEGHLNPLTIIDLSNRVINPAGLAIDYEILIFDGETF